MSYVKFTILCVSIRVLKFRFKGSDYIAYFRDENEYKCEAYF